jgi:transcriptional regulator with XRE-family HTH domain
VKKSIYSTDQDKLLALLRRKREQAQLTQVELAERLGRSQSFVSKYESGGLCLDLLSLRQVCQALGVSLSAFVKEFESQLHGT